MQEPAIQAAEDLGTQLGTIFAYALLCGLLAGFVFGLIATSMASKRGRNTVAAFFGGFFFGILSIIYYLIAGDSTELRIHKNELASAKQRINAKITQKSD